MSRRQKQKKQKPQSRPRVNAAKPQKLVVSSSFKGIKVKFKNKVGTITSCPPGCEMVQVTTADGARYVVELYKLLGGMSVKDRNRVLAVAKASFHINSTKSKPTATVATFTSGDTKIKVEEVNEETEAVDVSEPGVETEKAADETPAKEEKEEKETKAKDKEPDYEIPAPKITFTPYSWAKILFLRNCSDCEVGAFGIAEGENPLHITDVYIPKQEVTACTVEFADEGIADYFDEMVDRGLKPENFARIWIHTHPGMDPDPSTVDEATFYRAFGKCDWAVMFVIGDTKTYARLQFNTGPKGSQQIPVSVLYTGEFKASSHEEWKKEYDTKVTEGITTRVSRGTGLTEAELAALMHNGYGQYTGTGYEGYPTNRHPYFETEGRGGAYGKYGVEAGGFADTQDAAAGGAVAEEEVVVEEAESGEVDRSGVDWNALYRYMNLPAWEIQLLEEMDDEDDKVEFIYENYGIDVDEMMELNTIPGEEDEDAIGVVDVLADELASDEAAIKAAADSADKESRKRRREVMEA